MRVNAWSSRVSGVWSRALAAARGASWMLAALVLAIPLPALGQPAAESSAVVSLVGGSSEWIQRTGVALFTLSRELTPDDGRLGILIGDTDWSAMVDTTGTLVQVRPSRAGFPHGEHSVSVYLVSSAHEWQPIGQTTLRVLTAGGFERATTTPTLETGLTGQAGVGRWPATPPEPRDTFQDLTTRAGFQGQYVRHGWTTRVEAQAVGVSEREQALRFGDLQQAAPLVDLSSYQVSVGTGMVSLSAGHVAVGAHRLLLNGFASRGVSGAVRFGPAVDVALSAVNGSTLVGYGNLLGLGESQHRVLSASLGLELVPSRRGALRLSGSLMDGSIMPVTNVNQGAVRDPEESRGLGLQVNASDSAARFQLDAGAARSRFVNPRDPFAPADLAVVDVRETTRSARYLDASYAFLQNARLGRSATASLTAGVRHSRVEPLYRSVVLPVRADIEQHAADVTAALGATQSRFTVEAARDNLADLASILTTRTRQMLWSTDVPLQGFAGPGARAGAWPTISHSLTRVHQVADGLPTQALFDDLSQVPDQVSLNHTLGVSWQGSVWRGGYTLNRSLQDNRQRGREQADLLNAVHSVHAGVAPSPRVDVGVEFAFEDAEAREASRTDLTRRVSVSFTARPTSRNSLTGVVTRNRLEDLPRTSIRRTTDMNVTFTQNVSLMGGRAERLTGQFFVRYVRQAIYGLFLGAPGEDQTRFWTLNTGLTFKVF